MKRLAHSLDTTDIAALLERIAGEAPRKQPVEFVKRAAVVQELDIGPTTLDEWIAAGSFPSPIQLGPRAVRWLRSEVETWKQERLVSAREKRACRSQ
jgi:prophage regulatory protein